MRFAHFSVSLAIVLVLVGCVGGPKPPPQLRRAQADLKAARFKGNPVQKRAIDYLDAATLTAPAALNLNDASQITLRERVIYNASSAELAHLLRSADGGRFWKPGLTLTSGTSTFHLSLKVEGTKGRGPHFFTKYLPVDRLSEKAIRRPNKQKGIGGALLAIRRPARREAFAPKAGLSAPVTSLLEINGSAAQLELIDPEQSPTVRIHGKELPLEADFSAPLALHPQKNELLHGLLSMIQIEKYMAPTGLYFIEPYDPNKIPVIFVHGLMSTGMMWRNVANEVLADPELRRNYQVWVFNYPSGNPVAYSALRLREQLARVDRMYSPKRGYILVGHSMGGLLSRMQATSSRRSIWDRVMEGDANRLYAKLPPKNLLKRMFLFEANPRVKRIIFVCVPHRGSTMAMGFIGNLGRKLILLPSIFSEAIQNTVVGGVSIILGQKPLPTSIDSLSPRNSTLLALEKLPIQAPHHSIIGDRGKGNSPNSSDGIVPYWSSHLESAQSELIVPGGHSAFDMPQTIAEIQRILHLHLKSSRSARLVQARES